MGSLDRQVALVTGGGSGIGRAVVGRFVAEGARVAVMDRVASRAEELRAEFGDKVIALGGDVSRLSDNKEGRCDRRGVRPARCLCRQCRRL